MSTCSGLSSYLTLRRKNASSNLQPCLPSCGGPALCVHQNWCDFCVPGSNLAIFRKFRFRRRSIGFILDSRKSLQGFPHRFAARPSLVQVHPIERICHAASRPMNQRFSYQIAHLVIVALCESMIGATRYRLDIPANCQRVNEVRLMILQGAANEAGSMILRGTAT